MCPCRNHAAKWHQCNAFRTQVIGAKPKQTTQMTKHISSDHSKQLEQALLDFQTHEDASHDIHHARRVKLNALTIAKLEACESHTILVAAAYLHDLINLPKNAPNASQASRLSAEAAKPILQKLSYDDATIASIQHCIEAHSFSANIEATTLEAKILQDADRLESLGSLGIARTFYIAGKMDSGLFEGGDPFATDRELNDKAFAVDHFKVKLLGLAQTMKTDAGKKIAQQRIDIMQQFLRYLAEELHTDMPW